MHQLTSSNDDPFQYQLEDYIKQNLWKSMETKAVELLLTEADQSNSHISSGRAISAGLLAYHNTEVEEVTRAMTAYYQSFNFKNVEALMNFWLPNNYCELIIPGFEKAVSCIESAVNNTISDNDFFFFSYENYIERYTGSRCIVQKIIR